MRPILIHPLSFALSIVVSCILPVGCKTGGGHVWANFYRPNPAAKGLNPSPTTACSVRMGESERLDQDEADYAERRRTSDLAVEDWPEEEKLAAKNRFLTALQVKERGDEVAILGGTCFVSGRNEDPFDGRVEGWGKRLGADYAIVFRKSLGLQERVRNVPQTTFSSANVYGDVRGSGGWARGNAYGSGSSTTWTPMSYQVEQIEYRAYYLRRLQPGESDALRTKLSRTK